MWNVKENIMSPDPHYLDLLKLLGPLPSDYWMLELLAGRTVLELGCGAGNLAIPAAVRAFRYHAVDAVADLIRFIEEKDIQGLTTECCWFAQLNSHHKYGVVLSKSCLLNILDACAIAELIDCARRHMTDDGTAMFEVFNPQKCKSANYDYSMQSISFEPIGEDGKLVRCRGIYRVGEGYIMDHIITLLDEMDLSKLFLGSGLEITEINNADPLTLLVHAKSVSYQSR
jgi:Methyltransferase domain